MTVLKPSEFKARTGAILDKAKHAPVYVERDGTPLVITKARLVPAGEDPLLSPWELRARATESFYDPAKAWRSGGLIWGCDRNSVR